MNPAWAAAALGCAVLSAALALNDAMLVFIVTASVTITVFPAYAGFYTLRALGGAISAAKRHDPATGDSWSFVASACSSLVVTQDGVTTWVLILSTLPILRAASSFDATLVKRALADTPAMALLLLLAVRLVVEGLGSSDVSVVLEMAQEYARQLFRSLVALVGWIV